MIETTIYKCEYCGAEFDDWYEAHCHEWVCRYKEVSQHKGSCLGFYREDGTEIKFDVQTVYDDLEDMAAFIVGNDSDVKFVIGLLGWIGYDAPFGIVADKAHPNYYGLWYFDPDLHCGDWTRVDDQIKKWTDIKNKFIERAQYMFCKIMEYMFGGFLIIFTGILMIALIALIVWLIIDFIKK